MKFRFETYDDYLDAVGERDDLFEAGDLGDRYQELEGLIRWAREEDIDHLIGLRIEKYAD